MQLSTQRTGVPHYLHNVHYMRGKRKKKPESANKDIRNHILIFDIAFCAVVANVGFS